MNYHQLIQILNQATEEAEWGKTYVRLQWFGGYLSITYMHNDLLIQQALSCGSTQKVQYWEIEVEVKELIHAINLDTKSDPYFVDLCFNPETNTLTVSCGEKCSTSTELLAVECNSDEEYYLPSLNFLEESTTEKVVIPKQEWDKIDSAVCIARQNIEESRLLLEAHGDSIYISVKADSMAGYYCLETKAHPDTFNSIFLPFEVVDFIKTLWSANYIRLEFYKDWSVIVIGGDTRIFLKSNLAIKRSNILEEPNTNVRGQVNREELIKAIKDVSIENTSSNLISLYFTSSTSMQVEGGKGIKYLRVKAKNDEVQARILVSGDEFNDLLASINETNVSLSLPTNKFEPMVIKTLGTRIYYAGFISESPSKPRLRDQGKTRSPNYGSVPVVTEVFSRRQADGTTLVVESVEHSPLDYYKTLADLKAQDDALRLKKETTHMGDIVYELSKVELEELLPKAKTIAQKARTKHLAEPMRSELRDRLKELQEVLDETEERLKDEANQNLDWMKLAKGVGIYKGPTINVMNSINIRLKAGRVLEVMEQKAKISRLTMSVQPDPLAVEPEPRIELEVAVADEIVVRHF